ncbi:MAG: methyltransferase domain-containing protein [Deltaproteobacteria bacterium]|nr:methyltransferase domain-containing protein [Deltaproteobacteria bacterium]
MPTRDVYTHGHHASVLRSHVWRTAENSAAYLLDRLAPGLALLDVGCGPGTLTVDLARRVAPGRVVGIDRAGEVLGDARRHAESAGVAVELVEGDVYELPLPDAAFDVVHAHQVLQHLADPVAALREMRRVARPGGLVAVRDSDYSCFSWAPLDPLLDHWLAVYRAVARRNGAEPDAGRFLKGWARAAGFERVEASSSTWTFADPASCHWWGGLWAERCLLSAFGEQAVAYGIATRDELEAMAEAWRRWSRSPDAYIAVLHGELIATA